MAQVTITINAREYAVACEDGQEVRILQLANMLDEKARMITQGTGQINESMLLAMVGLLLADELSELKKSVAGHSSAEVVDNSRILETDRLLADQIKTLKEEIKFVASQINLM